MAKIPFDIKYRPQIESGEYKVVTKDNKHVRIISWDMHTSSGDKIVALVTGQGGQFEKNRTYLLDGRCCSSQHDSTSLFILTDSVGLTNFEMQYATYRYGSQAVEMFGQEQIEAVKKEWAAILVIAREELQGDMPHWNHIEAGCAGNGDIPPVYLAKDQYGCYALTSAVVGGDDYLVLSELDKLPKL